MMPIHLIQRLVGYSVSLLAMIAPSTGGSIVAGPQAADVMVIDGVASRVSPLTDVVLVSKDDEVVRDVRLNQLAAW